MDTLSILVVLALVATIITMIMGIAAMVAGGEVDDVYGTRLMWVRIGLQALAASLMVIALALH